ncbi:uncharacterized protein [Physcomitrium patens]|uniref:uncharacterized protein isoform X2 n=2 Tax=Physcomitrium patens TaxID=3218 RepID=UPI000D15784A|nr:uncharacterized protein LOC112278150 isoform X2 [Physcomitrium patens]|eukprot:XP_024367061.1 uncharacterized protein LOC112278150 isoform X2 [Physcomitrella patens]
MADGGGNSEEQIRSVDGQIRDLNDQIQSVHEQIRIVEEKIGRLEEEINRCPGDEERKLLRGKEALLRGEKAQLRDREAQLGGEKAQLRQRRDLGTEYEWLVQKVVPPTRSSRAGVYPSSSSHARMWLPVRVEHWDVMNEIEEFLESADRRRRVFRMAVTAVTQDTRLEEKHENHHIAFILGEMVSFMQKKEPQSNLHFKSEFIIFSKRKGGNDGIGSSEGASSSAMVDVYSGSPRADFVITLKEKNALVFEVKNEGLGSDGDDPWFLHRFWTDCSCTSGEGRCGFAVFGITPSQGERITRCISQLYEYMVLCKVGYGVLTDARNWYLFKRDNAGCLKISAGITASAEPPRVLAALSYLVHAAAVDNSEFGDPTGNGQFPLVHEAAPSEHSDESSDDDINDRTFTARVSQNISSSGKRRSERHSSGGAQLALEDVPAEDLNLKKAGGVISSEGWSGCVVNGRLRGQPVALKFAHLGTERAEVSRSCVMWKCCVHISQWLLLHLIRGLRRRGPVCDIFTDSPSLAALVQALLKEVVAYTRMEKLWGVFVPRLIGYGTTNNGRVVFIATELIDGVELGEVAVTREVETAALEALAAVHACGLLHGDVSLSNIMVVWGKKPTVRILDFGFSCITSNKKLQEAERVRLKRLFFTHGGAAGEEANDARYPYILPC